MTHPLPRLHPPHEPKEATVLTPEGTSSPRYDELPADDYLVVARRADLALAHQIEAETRRPVHDWAHDLTGPTEAWAEHLEEVAWGAVRRHLLELDDRPALTLVTAAPEEEAA
jgi:hypothetical protein